MSTLYKISQGTSLGFWISKANPTIHLIMENKAVFRYK